MDSLFSKIRTATNGILMVATFVLTISAVLSVWEVLARDVLSKSLLTILILVIGSILITIATYERDGITILSAHERPPLWRVIALILFLLVGVPFLLNILLWFF